MTELSKEAQAVLDAAFTLADNLDRDVTEAEMIAAALRATANEAASLPSPSNSGDPEMLKGIWDERRTIRAKLLAIAAELDGQ